ncbi:hypothetical protein HOLleu_12034 [Holothuria leucospilota]|uniref:Uncharacterized protein n=1 Tax=Holothuria leucospilota TaxID=206669 RepID=A0A9Q1HCR9_HOLLE|nr:hypothetical protein HOLleu_12034 [Holothuria leucospilota]
MVSAIFSHHSNKPQTGHGHIQAGSSYWGLRFQHCCVGACKTKMSKTKIEDPTKVFGLWSSYLDLRFQYTP